MLVRFEGSRAARLGQAMAPHVADLLMAGLGAVLDFDVKTKHRRT